MDENRNSLTSKNEKNAKNFKEKINNIIDIFIKPLTVIGIILIHFLSSGNKRRNSIILGYILIVIVVSLWRFNKKYKEEDYYCSVIPESAEQETNKHNVNINTSTEKKAKNFKEKIKDNACLILPVFILLVPTLFSLYKIAKTISNHIIVGLISAILLIFFGVIAHLNFSDD